VKGKMVPDAEVIAAQSAGQPVISVDTKKKELIGNFKNGGTDYRPKGDLLDVNVQDFKDKELGKVVPHGVYDPTTNAGWVSVGITHDTAEFAVQSIRTWLDRIGRPRYTICGSFRPKLRAHDRRDRARAPVIQRRLARLLMVSTWTPLQAPPRGVATPRAQRRDIASRHCQSARRRGGTQHGRGAYSAGTRARQRQHDMLPGQHRQAAINQLLKFVD
jgi:hypothetical protein